MVIVKQKEKHMTLVVDGRTLTDYLCRKVKILLMIN